MKKRVFKTIISGCFLLYILLFAGVAMANTDEDLQSYLLYENDFESYEGGSFCTDDARWTATYASNSKKYVDESGNVWMQMSIGKYTAYDFAIAEDATIGLSSGKIAFSFDAKRAKTTTATNNTYLRFVSTEGINVNFMFIDNVTSNIYLEGNQNVKYQMTDNVPVRVDVLIDLDKDIFTLVVDGKIVSTYSYAIKGELKSMRFAPADGLMIDDLKIAYTQNGDFGFECEETKMSDDMLKMKFSQTISADADINDIVLKNLYTGEQAIIVGAGIENGNEIQLLAENLDITDEYVIEFPENFKSAFGEELKAYKEIIEPKIEDGEFALTKVLLYDYEGQCYNLSDELPAVLKQIELDFSGVVEDEFLEDKISILSKNEQTGEKIPILVESTEQKVIVSLDGTFYENEDYILKIDKILNSMADESKKSYEILLSAGAGKLTVTDYGFYKDGIRVEDDEILPGDVLKVKFSVLKPNRTNRDMFISYGIYEGNFMTRFKSQKITISENETKASGELEVKIPEAESFTLKSFLWGSSNGFPITKKIELKR